MEFPNNDKRSVFFGCDGHFRAQVDTLSCLKEGKTCSEEDQWKKKLEERRDKGTKRCLGKPSSSMVGTVKCKGAQPKRCDSSPSPFWNKNNDDNSYTCRKTGRDGSNTTYIHKSQPDEKCKFVCQNPEGWSEWSEILGINSGTVKGRFCRNDQDCLLMETERRSSSGTLKKEFVDTDCS